MRTRADICTSSHFIQTLTSSTPISKPYHRPFDRRIRAITNHQRHIDQMLLVSTEILAPIEHHRFTLSEHEQSRQWPAAQCRHGAKIDSGHHHGLCSETAEVGVPLTRIDSKPHAVWSGPAEGPGSAVSSIFARNMVSTMARRRLRLGCRISSSGRVMRGIVEEQEGGIGVARLSQRSPRNRHDGPWSPPMRRARCGPVAIDDLHRRLGTPEATIWRPAT